MKSKHFCSSLQNSGGVTVPPRIVMPTAADNCLFCMPATDGQVAMTKLISFTPGNAQAGRPTIQGDIVVFDAATGERQLILDGPTVTARRTAAVSLLAARRLAPGLKAHCSSSAPACRAAPICRPLPRAWARRKSDSLAQRP